MPPPVLSVEEARLWLGEHCFRVGGYIRLLTASLRGIWLGWINAGPCLPAFLRFVVGHGNVRLVVYSVQHSLGVHGMVHEKQVFLFCRVAYAESRLGVSASSGFWMSCEVFGGV